MRGGKGSLLKTASPHTSSVVFIYRFDHYGFGCIKQYETTQT